MCVNNQDRLINESVKLVKMKEPLGEILECYTGQCETVGSHHTSIPISQAKMTSLHRKNHIFR